MEEVWKDIRGYEQVYQVSNLGRVKSLERVVDFGRSYRTVHEMILKQYIQNNGYVWVGLHKNNTQKRMLVHRLVAMAFIPNPDNLPEVNHKDENPLNNTLSNLEWCTRKYNENYGTKKQRQTLKQSIPVAAYKDGVEIMRFASSMEAQRNGYNQQCVRYCCRGIYKTYRGYEWRETV